MNVVPLRVVNQDPVQRESMSWPEALKRASDLLKTYYPRDDASSELRIRDSTWTHAASLASVNPVVGAALLVLLAHKSKLLTDVTLPYVTDPRFQFPRMHVDFVAKSWDQVWNMRVGETCLKPCKTETAKKNAFHYSRRQSRIHGVVLRNRSVPDGLTITRVE